MLRRLTVVVLFLFAAPEVLGAKRPANLPPPPRLAKKRTVAVLPVEAFEVPAELVAQLEVLLVREIEEAPAMSAVAPNAVVADVIRVGLTTECDGDVACVALAGRYARAHLAVETRLAYLGGTISISLRLVDTRKGRELRRVADPLPEDEQKRSERLHNMAVQLLQPKSYVGDLVINCSQEGAEIYVDDKLVGASPLKKPLRKLDAGPHILRVSKTGYSDFYRFVDVAYKRTTTFNVDLEMNDITDSVKLESSTGFGQVFVAAGTPGLEVRVDGEPRGVTPLEGAIIQVPGGNRRLSLRMVDVESYSEEIEVVAGTRTDVGVAVEGETMRVGVVVGVDPNDELPTPERIFAAAALTAPIVEEEDSDLLVTGLVLAGIGAASIVVSVIVGLEVESVNDALDSSVAEYRALGPFELQRKSELRADVEGMQSRGPALEATQWATLWLGVGLMVAATTVLTWEFADVLDGRTVGPDGGIDASIGAAVRPDLGAATLMLSGRF